MPGTAGPFDDGLVTEHYDVIIVGSGAGGGTLAHTLAPSGKRILLLERGDQAEHPVPFAEGEDAQRDQQDHVMMDRVMAHSIPDMTGLPLWISLVTGPQ